jgi:iron-sulfur cluster insertion protein
MDEGFDTCPVSFTPSAIEKVIELLAETGEENLALRIFVQSGGCAGFQYGFAFDESRAGDDMSFENGGARLLLDPMSMQYLMGAEVDYEDGLEGSRFVIRNPNAESTCSCGSSFAM